MVVVSLIQISLSATEIVAFGSNRLLKYRKLILSVDALISRQQLIKKIPIINILFLKVNNSSL